MLRNETDIPTQILMAGLPGKMATLVVENTVQNSNFLLHPLALSSERHHGETFRVLDREFLLSSINHWPVFFTEATLPYDVRGHIAVDFTTPDAAVLNAQFYADHMLPFVMGTSGGNRQMLENIVRRSEIYAVIAANMDPQIIRRQMDIDQFAERNPGVFNLARVEITESHQATKRDTSGTAIAFGAQFQQYGALPADINSIRDTRYQEEVLGIPNPDRGHAYHWVTVRSPWGEGIIYEFTTAVQGRNSYVEGTLMAARFLDRQRSLGAEGRVFTMRDVLEGGEN